VESVVPGTQRTGFYELFIPTACVFVRPLAGRGYSASVWEAQEAMSSQFDRVDIRTNPEWAEQFIERLATLGPVDWLSIAASVTQTASSRAEANEALDRVIAQHGLAVDAWNIADDVETAFHYSVGANGHTPSPRESLSLHIARQAASKAALALFIRPLLAAADFDSLYRPFASLMPAATERSPRRPDARAPLKLVSA